MLSLPEVADRPLHLRENVFWRSLMVFPDGSREVVLQKTGRVQQERFRVPSPEARQRAINVRAGRLPRSEDSVRNAAARARRMVRWKCRAGQFDHMLTLTYRENVTCRGQMVNDWAKFVKLVQARYKGWSFLAVPEKQKRGAYHVHAAVKGWQNVNYLRACWYRVVGKGMGNIDVRAPWRRGKKSAGKIWSSSNLANYLSKYIGKSFEESSALGERRFWPSKGIQVPERLVSICDAETWEKAIEGTFSMAAEGVVADGIKQWGDVHGLTYWVFSPAAPPPPF